jgi:hypothetical protein
MGDAMSTSDLEKADLHDIDAFQRTTPDKPLEQEPGKKTREFDDAPNHGVDDRDTSAPFRTKSAVSIAETLSLPREIAFVSVVCMAQFMTRSSPFESIHLMSAC